MKRIHSAVIGALALTFAGAGFAAGTSGAMSSDSGSMSSSAGAATKAPDLSASFKSTDLIGMNVSNRQNDNLGSVSNLIIGKDGKVSHVVLNETGGATTGGKYIIPWERVQFAPGQSTAMVDVDRTALSAEFAAFDESMVPAPSDGSMQSAPPTGGSSGTMSPPPASGGGGY